MKVSFAHRKLRKGFTLVELLVVIAIIALLAGVAYGPILNQINKGHQMQALSNMKNVYVAMEAFKGQRGIGNYPDDNTARVLGETKKYMSSYGKLEGETSNDYFRQLLSSDSVTEENFYAKVQTPEGGVTTEPDGIVDDGKALAPGEVGISYVMAKTTTGKKLGIGGKGGVRPLMVTSVLSAEDGSTVVPAGAIRFDDESFRGNVLIYKTDNSAATIELDENGALPTPFIPKRRGKDETDGFIVLTPDFSGQE